MTRRLPPGERLALTVAEAAELVGVSRSKGYECVRRGEWPSIRVGADLRVPRRAFEAMIEEQARR